MNTLTDTLNADVPPSIAVEIHETVLRFFNLHNQLSDVLREENKILKERQFGNLTEIMNRKGPLIELYQGDLRYLQHNATVVKGLGAEIKVRLASAREEMATLTSDNMVFLDRAMKSSQRVVDLIVNVMKDAKRTSTFYGASGAVAEATDTTRMVKINQMA